MNVLGTGCTGLSFAGRQTQSIKYESEFQHVTVINIVPIGPSSGPVTRTALADRPEIPAVQSATRPIAGTDDAPIGGEDQRGGVSRIASNLTSSLDIPNDVICQWNGRYPMREIVLGRVSTYTLALVTLIQSKVHAHATGIKVQTPPSPILFWRDERD